MDNILQAIEEVGKEAGWEYRLTPLLLCLYRTSAGKAATSTSEGKENEGLRLMWPRCVPHSCKPRIFVSSPLPLPFGV